MSNKNILIIGGTGQYGMTLSQMLSKKKYNVFATSRFIKKVNYFNTKYPKIRYLKLNIINENEIKKILKKTKPSIIFYFAGQSSPQKSFKKRNETLKSNFEGCKKVLKIIQFCSFVGRSINYYHFQSVDLFDGLGCLIYGLPFG